jgi:DNA helicase-2/ATP-dependent DNA helicase PcrA
MPQGLLDTLTAAQRKAVLHHEGPLLVLAGPGSGKTRVITYRIAALVDRGVKPYNICAITFTNKAAEEMRQRATALGVSRGAHISTFHSLCVRILRTYAEQADVRSGFSIYDDADQNRCIKQAVKDCQLDTASVQPSRLLDAISTLKSKLIDATDFQARATDFFSQALAKVYARYQAILDQDNALDFDDLLMKAALLVENDQTVCAALADRYRFLLIDEYQDTNHAQYRLAKAMALPHGNICATGDPDQSIYRWRGADIRNILAFERDWPKAEIVKLEENFRSTAEILQVADSLIARNQNRKHKNLIPVRSDPGKVSVEGYGNEAAEADTVAQRVKQLLSERIRANQIAVFYRVNSMSRSLEEAFIRHRLPYQIVRGVEFYSRKEIRDLLAYLRVLVNPADEIALVRIINTPTRGIGQTTVERARDFAAHSGISLSDALKRADQITSLNKSAQVKLAAFGALLDKLRRELDGPVAPLMERVLRESGLEDSLQKGGSDGQNALENIGELINTATQYDGQTTEPSLLDYLQQIALYSDTDAYDATSERISLMTLHAAKGLEFEHVFIIGLEDGLLPHERGSRDGDDLEEERRLFFVGVTRAKTSLYISYAQYRTARGQTLRTTPSPFLFELGAEYIPRTDYDLDVTSERWGPGGSGKRELADGLSCRTSGGAKRTLAMAGRAAPSPSPSDLRMPPAQSAKEPEFVPGQLVRHKTFGLGRIKKYVDMGANSVVTVQFNTGPTKSFLLQYAHLTKV